MEYNHYRYVNGSYQNTDGEHKSSPKDDFFSDTFRDMYKDIEKEFGDNSFTSTYPNIFNYHYQQPQSQSNTKDETVRNNSETNIKHSNLFSNSKMNNNTNKNVAKKTGYGVKTLLDKNKLIYPFNNMNNMHSSFNHVDKDTGRFANHIPNTFNLSVTPKYDAANTVSKNLSYKI